LHDGSATKKGNESIVARYCKVLPQHGLRHSTACKFLLRLPACQALRRGVSCAF
jgi:hypothetical protein